MEDMLSVNVTINVDIFIRILFSKVKSGSYPRLSI